MALQDITIECRVCKQNFVWTKKEQEWYGGQGWLQPKRCKKCRNLRKKYGQAKRTYDQVRREVSINDRSFVNKKD